MRSIVAVTNEVDDAKIAVSELLEQIKDKEPLAKHSLGLVYCDVAMANDNKLEGNIIRENLPQDITFSGLYSYGEICPTVFANGKAVNRAHNSSIVMCVL